MGIDSAIKVYMALIRGNAGVASLLAQLAAAIIISAALFVIFNIGEGAVLVLWKFDIPYNPDVLFMLDPKIVFHVDPPVSERLKALEFIVTVIAILLLVAVFFSIKRRLALSDALSVIRHHLLGDWELTLVDFASQSPTDLACEINFGETVARKLRASIVGPKDLKFACETAMIALYVAESGQEISLNLPIKAEVQINGNVLPFFYLIEMQYIAFKGKNQLQFDVDWASIFTANEYFNKIGTGKMIKKKSQSSA